MEFKEYKEKKFKYKIRAKSIICRCAAIDSENTVAVSLWHDLLLELSKEHAVFFAAYRLPDESITEIFDPTVILEQAEVIFEPCHIFFHLSEAKIDITNMFLAGECTLYFFERDVDWADFLLSSEIGDSNLRKLVKSGKLCAYLQMYDHVTKYFFECNRAYEERLRKFFEDMERAGYKVIKGRVRK